MPLWPAQPSTQPQQASNVCHDSSHLWLLQGPHSVIWWGGYVWPKGPFSRPSGRQQHSHLSLAPGYRQLRPSPKSYCWPWSLLLSSPFEPMPNTQIDQVRGQEDFFKDQGRNELKRVREMAIFPVMFHAVKITQSIGGKSEWIAEFPPTPYILMSGWKFSPQKYEGNFLSLTS